jgi:hypothetical protein
MAFGFQDLEDYSRMDELNSMHLEWPTKRKPIKKPEPRLMIPTPCRKCGNIQPSYRAAMEHCRGLMRGRPRGKSGRLRIRAALESVILESKSPDKAQVDPCKTEETGL